MEVCEVLSRLAMESVKIIPVYYFIEILQKKTQPYHKQYLTNQVAYESYKLLNQHNASQNRAF